MSQYDHTCSSQYIRSVPFSAMLKQGMFEGSESGSEEVRVDKDSWSEEDLALALQNQTVEFQKEQFVAQPENTIVAAHRDVDELQTTMNQLETIQDPQETCTIAQCELFNDGKDFNLENVENSTIKVHIFGLSEPSSKRLAKKVESQSANFTQESLELSSMLRQIFRNNKPADASHLTDKQRKVFNHIIDLMFPPNLQVVPGVLVSREKRKDQFFKKFFKTLKWLIYSSVKSDNSILKEKALYMLAEKLGLHKTAEHRLQFDEIFGSKSTQCVSKKNIEFILNWPALFELFTSPNLVQSSLDNLNEETDKDIDTNFISYANEYLKPHGNWNVFSSRVCDSQSSKKPFTYHDNLLAGYHFYNSLLKAGKKLCSEKKTILTQCRDYFDKENHNHPDDSN